ncbi:SOS response-associated peptidase [Planctomicrobium sp. SH668]|uniref:SOS response-associated peptidase n=1 Tax=Planctomicrobium sp. SH668 TaxID=3448126 RepID=UPI003F5C62BD
MCGRYNLRVTPNELQEFFSLFRAPEPFPPRYNIAPTQQVLAIRNEDGERIASPFRWGLIPGWAKDIKQGAKMINIRSDTLAEKPTFKANLKRRRCLIPTTGFYEWQPGPGKTKQPFHIHSRDGQLMAFAGLWDHWEKNDPSIDSCGIITTDANRLMQPLHNRMPVILPAELWNVWLDPDVDPRELLQLLTPWTDDDLVAEPVSTAVNNVRNTGPECLALMGSGSTPPLPGLS